MADFKLTAYQEMFISLGYEHRNLESKDRGAYWTMIKESVAQLDILVSVYNSLVQIDEICTVEELKKSDLDLYNKYAEWALKLDPAAYPGKIIKYIKAAAAFKYLKNT